MALCTLEQVKLFLGIAGATDDALLTDLINSVSSLFGKWTCRTLEQQQHTEYHDGRGGSMIMLRNYPVIAVASVKVDGQEIPARPAPGLNGYSFSDISVRLTGYSFGRGWGNVEIVYTAGYSTIPDDLEQAAIEAVAFWYKQRHRTGQTSVNVEGQTLSFIRSELPAMPRRVIELYRRVTPT